MLTLVCKKCQQELPLERFRYAKSESRHRTICRECEKAQKRQHYQDIRLGRKQAQKRHGPCDLETIKICTECGISKTLNDFPAQVKFPQRWHHWKSHCKDCCRIFQRKRLKEGYKRPSSNLLEHKLLANVRGRNKSRHHAINIGISDIRNLLATQSDSGQFKCAATRVIFLESGLLSPSIDRIDNAQGYISDNIRLVTKFYNWARYNYDDARFLQLLKDRSLKPSIDEQKVIKRLWQLCARRINGKISFADIRQCLRLQNCNCNATGLPLVDELNHPFRPSLDRIDSSVSYQPGNIQITTVFYNRGKNQYQNAAAIVAYKATIAALFETTAPLGLN